MVIIEGPDGAGKTHLAHQLCRDLDLHYMKPPPRLLSSETGPVDPRGLADWWWLEVTNVQDGRRNRHVYDRSTYISDPIYRLIFGDKSGSTAERMRDGISTLARYALIIFCLPGQEVCYQSAVDEHRENLRLPDQERHEVLYWVYEYMYHMWWEILGPMPCLKYDRNNYEEIKKEVGNWTVR